MKHILPKPKRTFCYIVEKTNMTGKQNKTIHEKKENNLFLFFINHPVDKKKRKSVHGCHLSWYFFYVKMTERRHRQKDCKICLLITMMFFVAVRKNALNAGCFIACDAMTMRSGAIEVRTVMTLLTGFESYTSPVRHTVLFTAAAWAVKGGRGGGEGYLLELLSLKGSVWIEMFRNMDNVELKELITSNKVFIDESPNIVRCMKTWTYVLSGTGVVFFGFHGE